jgi:hypothetical protein
LGSNDNYIPRRNYELVKELTMGFLSHDEVALVNGPAATAVTLTGDQTVEGQKTFADAAEFQNVVNITGGQSLNIEVSNQSAFSMKVDTDVDSRLVITNEGKIRWGDGATSVDANIFRSAANALTVDGNGAPGSLHITGDLTVDGTSPGGGSGTGSTFVYDNTASAADNTYSDFALLLTAMDNVQGRKDVYMKTPWFPDAGFFNLDDVHFHGDPNAPESYSIYIEPGTATTFSMNRGGLHNTGITSYQSDGVVWTPTDDVSEFEMSGNAYWNPGAGVSPYFVELTGFRVLTLLMSDVSNVANNCVDVGINAILNISLYDSAEISTDIVAGTGTLNVNAYGTSISYASTQANFTGTLVANAPNLVQLGGNNIWTGTNEFRTGILLGDGAGTVDLSYTVGVGGGTVFSGYDIQGRNILADQGMDISNWLTFDADNTAYIHGGGVGVIEVSGELHTTQGVNISDILTFGTDPTGYIHGTGTSGLLEMNGSWTITDDLTVNGISGFNAEVTFTEASINSFSAGPYQDVIALYQTGDGNTRISIDATGDIRWGDGTAVPDTTLARTDSGELQLGLSTDAQTRLVFAGIQPQIAMRNVDSGNPTTRIFGTRTDIDSGDRFGIDGNGKLSWSDGTDPDDTFLYRDSAAILRTDGDLVIGTSLSVLGNTEVDSNLAFTGDAPRISMRDIATGDSVNNILRVRETSDSDYRFQLHGDGKMLWGDGSTPPDTFLYRNGGGQLKTDGEIALGAQLEFTSDFPEISMLAMDTASSEVFQSKELLDSDPRFLFRGDGKLEWGDGTAASDTSLYRSGIGQLKMDGGNLHIGASDEILINTNNGITMAGDFYLSVTEQTTAINPIVYSYVAGDTDPRYSVRADGELTWGVGAGATDTNLYRYDVNKLKTDGSLIVTEALQVLGNAFIGNAITDTLGFFGTTAVAQQATPSTLGDVIALLQAYGLSA